MNKRKIYINTFLEPFFERMCRFSRQIYSKINRTHGDIIANSMADHPFKIVLTVRRTESRFTNWGPYVCSEMQTWGDEYIYNYEYVFPCENPETISREAILNKITEHRDLLMGEVYEAFDSAMRNLKLPCSDDKLV